MVNVKVSISLPEDLLKRLDEFCKRFNIPRSEYIAKVLEERFGEATVGGFRYPTVPWKLSLPGYLKFRSPRFRGRIIKKKWVVEDVENEP